jgi:hypothetical protein
MFRPVLVFAALLVAAACTPSEPPAVSVARAVLERAGPATPFVDASTAAMPAIAHEPSGMICPLPKQGAFDFGTFPPGAANEGAFCSTSDDGLVVTMLAIRFDKPASLDQVFADALAAGLAKASPRPWRGAKEPAEALPRNVRIARLEGLMDGEPVYLRTATAQAHGWFLQQFAQAPADKAATAEARAAQQWRHALELFEAPRPAKPASSRE